MADIEKLTDDLAIMQKLGDNPNTDDGLTAAELKAKFDAAPLIIQKYINDVLIPAVNNSIKRNGGAVQGNIDMSGYKVTNLGTPANAGDAVPLEYSNSHYAPAGYGLGGQAKWISDAVSARTLTKTGWYAWGNNTMEDVPYSAGAILVLGRLADRYITQIAFHANFSAIHMTEMCIRTLGTEDETDGAWEYINPPMAPGVEYRTTERHNGKAVYAQLINCGTASTLSTGLSFKLSLTGIIRVAGTVGVVPLVDGSDSELIDGHGRGMGVRYSSGAVYISFATASEFDGQNQTVTLWYTKD